MKIMSPAVLRQALEETVPPTRIGLIVPSSNVKNALRVEER